MAKISPLRMFIDEISADIKQYIGPPSLAARYAIFKSCIDELSRVGILAAEDTIIDLKTMNLMRYE
jgi:SpoVK/Ycf46/Vps4 family AAA+-type ATPase